MILSFKFRQNRRHFFREHFLGFDNVTMIYRVKNKKKDTPFLGGYSCDQNKQLSLQGHWCQMKKQFLS